MFAVRANSKFQSDRSCSSKQKNSFTARYYKINREKAYVFYNAGLRLTSHVLTNICNHARTAELTNTFTVTLSKKIDSEC